MNELALFAGAGGGILAGEMLGWRTVAAVERDAYAAQVLAQRQNDGFLKTFPIWSDVRSFDGRPWREIVDVISGGFPCQDISIAGKGAGIEGERSGLWKEFLRIICEILPKKVFVENSSMLTNRGLGVVLGDLAQNGYDAKWMCLSASDVGAPHKRERIWILATNTNCQPDGQQLKHEITRGNRFDISKKMAHATSVKSNAISNNKKHVFKSSKQFRTSCGKNYSEPDWWEAEPAVCRVVNGVADRMDFINDRLKALGNGQVPLCAAQAYRILENI